MEKIRIGLITYINEADHISVVQRYKDALKKAERLLTELYPSEPAQAEHANEYYAVNAVNAVLNKARALLAEEKGEPYK